MQVLRAQHAVQAGGHLDDAALSKVCARCHTHFVPFKPQHPLADYLLWVLHAPGVDHIS